MKSLETAVGGTARGEDVAPRPSLHKEVSFLGALAVALAVMGPTSAMNLNPILPATLAGRAVPLVYLLATIGVFFVAYGFVRLSQRFNHAGSVYAFNGVTLGPRVGFISGWALLGTYVLYGVALLAGMGLYSQTLLDQLGISSSTPWMPVALGAAVLLTVLAYLDVRVVAKALLSVEGLSIILMLILTFTIFARLISGNAPDDQTFTLEVFSPASGTEFSNVLLAVVFGFLSFAGFEAAASMGEETRDPTRNIPRALLGTILVGGLLFVVVTAAETMGFGTDAAGVEAFAGSTGALGDLAGSYIGSAMSDALVTGALLSAFGAGLACIVAATRMVFAFGRVGLGPSALGRVSERTGEPAAALAVVIALVLAILLGLRLLATDVAIDVFFWTATIGTFPLLVIYAVTNVGAFVLLFVRERAAPTVPRWEAVVPVIAVVIVGYVLYKNLIPVPDHPYNLFPYIAAGWLAAGAAVAIGFPGLTRRIGEDLAAQEGFDRGR